jgi:hypothetical protein
MEAPLRCLDGPLHDRLLLRPPGTLMGRHRLSSSLAPPAARARARGRWKVLKGRDELRCGTGSIQPRRRQNGGRRVLLSPVCDKRCREPSPSSRAIRADAQRPDTGQRMPSGGRRRCRASVIGSMILPSRSRARLEITAAVMAANSTDQFRPLRLHSRISLPSFSATIRKPSCFSSCSHPSPAGTFAASTGRAGRMKPGACADPERDTSVIRVAVADYNRALT